MAIAPVMNVNFKGNGYNTSFKGKEVDVLQLITKQIANSIE